MSTTLAQLLQDFVERYELGEVGVTTGAGTVTTIVDATRFGGSLRAGNEYPQRSQLMALSGSFAGAQAFLSDFAPDTGTFTVTPTLAGTLGTAASFIVVPPWVAPVTDRFTEALNRYLTGRARRLMRVGLTQVPGGDLLRTFALDGWQNGTGATGTYVDGELGHDYSSTLLQVVTTLADQYVFTGRIHGLPLQEWDLWLIMWPEGAYAPKFWIYDDNGVEIIPSIISGAQVGPALHGAGMEVRARFTLPSNAASWRIRLGSTTAGATVRFSPILAQPVGGASYSISSRADNRPGELGDFFTRNVPAGAGAAAAAVRGTFRRAPVVFDAIEQYGPIMGIKFGQVPPFPLFYDGYLPYGELALVTDDTDCPKELALRGMAWEFFKWAGRRVRRKQGDPEPTRWATDQDAALQELIEAEDPNQYGPEFRFAQRRQYNQRIFMG